ncbi:MAG TPA: hypothetical protein VF848_04440 [Steroidobacteraceae bacterium]
MALLLALTALASCTTPPHRPPSKANSTEIFDEQTGSTLLVVSKPLVFARERSDVSAHARDYATLVAVEDDRSGQYTQYLLLYRWSTVDRRMSPPPGPDEGEIKILADGRTIDLHPLERPPTSLAQRQALHVPEHGDLVYRSYRVDSAMLHYIANSRDLTVRMPQESLDTPFTVWEDGRGALTQFLQRAVAP